MGKLVDVSPQTIQSIIDNLPKNPPGKPVISSVEEARRMQTQVAFRHDVDDLHNRIKLRISQLDNDKTPELQEANKFIINKLKCLLNVQIPNKETLEYVDWYFNYGDLRTEDEVAEKEQELSTLKYIQSGTFDNECTTSNITIPLASFIVGFSLTTFGCANDIGHLDQGACWLIASIPGVMIGLLSFCIGCIVSHSRNIRRGERHNIPSSHPRMRQEQFYKNLGTVSLGIAGISVVRKAGKSVKEIGNVDGWREMK